MSGCAKGPAHRATEPPTTLVTAPGIRPTAPQERAPTRGENPVSAERVARLAFEGDDGAELFPIIHADEQFTLPTITEQLDRDLLELKASCFDRGELLAAVELAAVVDRPPFFDVQFRIERGPRFRVAKVSVVDTNMNYPVQSPAAKKLRAELTGQTFMRRAIVEGLAALRREYENAGYADVFIDLASPMLDPQRPIVNVEVKVTPGLLFHVDHVEVVGNVHVSKASILRHVVVREKGLYDADEIEESVRTLEAVGLFSRVWASTKTTTFGNRTVTFEVTEGVAEPRPSGIDMLAEARRVRLQGRRFEARAMAARISRNYAYSKVAKDATVMEREIDAELGWAHD